MTDKSFSYNPRMLQRLWRGASSSGFMRKRFDASLLLLFGLVFAFGLSLARRAIVLSDEGYLLLQALDMANGKVVYRDMDSFVAPGVWFLLAGVFSVFEPSVLASRVVALLGYTGTAWVCYRIVFETSGRVVGFSAVAALMVFTVWAFPAWTFSFYSPYSILFALAALTRLLVWRRTRRDRELVLSGVLLGLSLTFKQNYGVLALLGAGIAVLAIRLEARERPVAALGGALRSGLRLCVGLALVGVPLLAYFVHHDALAPTFEALVLHPFADFLGKHDIPYLRLSGLWNREQIDGVGRLTYTAYAFTNSAMRFHWYPFFLHGVERLHVLMYWLPLLAFGLGAWLSVSPTGRDRPIDGGLLSVLAVCGFLFLGVLPRADYNHLVNVYQPAIIAVAVVAQRCVQRARASPPRFARTIAAACGVLMLLYAYVAAYWYLDIVNRMDTRISSPRAGVLVTEAEARMIDFEVNAIRSRTRLREPVLTLPGLSMLNFLAERPMPSRYYNLYAVHVAHDQGAGVVEGAKANRVQLAVAEYNDFFSERVRLREYAPALTSYIRRNFTVE